MTLNNSSTNADACCKNECCARCAQLRPSTSNESTPQEMPPLSSVLDKMLTTPSSSRRSSYHLESKVDMVCELLSMLGCQEHVDVGETLLNLSNNHDTCLAMRQSGCVPLLVQLMQLDKDSNIRNKAARAICNLISAQPDERIRKRETKVFRFLEEIKSFSEELRKNNLSKENCRHPLDVCIQLMKLSFDEDHRQVICHFGGIHDLANLIEAEHVHHGATPDLPACNSIRKYICMTLTNATFGDSGNKALLCSYRQFMRSVVVQLQSTSEELRQVSAAILRNLSWHADTASKDMLREVGAVAGLIKAAIVTTEENTLRCILSALWNFSAHSTENKAEICAIEGALEFLVKALSYQSASDSFSIVENAGGVLRNISSQIAVRDDYREVLRKHNCLQALIEHLKSSNVTILINACGIAWNLSAKCVVDQDALIKSDAADLLSSLTASKHKSIARSASAALKNLIHSAQKRADGDSFLAKFVRKHQDFLVNNVDAATICDESLFFDNIYEYIPMSDLKRKFEAQKNLNLKKNLNDNKTNEENQQPPNSYHCKPKHLPPAPKSTITSSPGAYISVRNKFSDCACEDEIENTEQPIDYSRKYAEVKVSNMQNENVTKPCSYANKTVKENKNSGIYAETDLDQPTDYALQYAEDDSDSDCDKVSKNGREEFVQDTVKTYCTEGTPYETPFNFSTATSMSDLRVEPNENRDKPIAKQHDSANDDFKSGDSLQIKTTAELVKSSYSSGLLSPDKPINFCEEGTPGYFSRVSSFESLTAVSPNENLKEKDKMEKNSTVAGTSAIKTSNKMNTSPSEAKVVKFEQVLNYAEETPLMFSRTSSLASLDSIEQHSIHDDRSSIISDFSRRTSGVISPSELPDSPTQMVPPSPKGTNIVDSSLRTNASDDAKSVNRKLLSKSTIFEDKLIEFKDENTPIQFSAATSLSSLTIDDEPGRRESARREQEENLKQQHDDEIRNHNEIEEVRHEVSNEFDDELLAQDDENDDEILAACIKMGMPSKRNQQQERSNSTASKTEIDGLSDSSLSEEESKLLAECIQAGMPRSKSVVSTTSNSYSFADEKEFGSLKKRRNIDLIKQNKLHLHESSSYETGLDSKRGSVRAKSSCSDCSHDREFSRGQHSTQDEAFVSCSKRILAPPSADNIKTQAYNTRQNTNHNQPSAPFEIENTLTRERFQHPRSTNNSPFPRASKDNGKSYAEPRGKPEFSRSLPHNSAQGRINMQRQKLMASVKSPSNDSVSNVFYNQKVHHSGLLPRKTAIPIPTPAANATLCSKLTITSHRIAINPPNFVNDYKTQQCQRVPLDCVSDPRLIHPAMEDFAGLKSKIDKRHHKDKMIPKMKKNRTPQDLQRRLLCGGSFSSAKDEVEKYAVEHSPAYSMSLRSSLSDLTIDGSVISHLASQVVSPHPEEQSVENCAGTSLQKASYSKQSENNQAKEIYEQKEKKEPENAAFLFEDDDQNDDDILAACIQLGMRGKSFKSPSGSVVSKHTSNNNPCLAKSAHSSDGEGAASQPLVGRLETGAISKLSFKLKNTAEASKAAEAVKNISKENPSTASVSAKDNNEQRNFPNALPIRSACVASSQELLSSRSSESVSAVESEQTTVSLELSSSATETAECPKVAKKGKKSKSRKGLAEKMGKVVDLLKLRKN